MGCGEQRQALNRSWSARIGTFQALNRLFTGHIGWRRALYRSKKGLIRAQILPKQIRNGSIRAAGSRDRIWPVLMMHPKCLELRRSWLGVSRECSRGDGDPVLAQSRTQAQRRKLRTGASTKGTSCRVRKRLWFWVHRDRSATR
jgi:hypothetical protein